MSAELRRALDTIRRTPRSPGLVFGDDSQARELARLREIERMARDVYGWLERNSLHTTGHGRGLAEVLGIAARRPPEEDDGA